MKVTTPAKTSSKHAFVDKFFEIRGRINKDLLDVERRDRSIRIDIDPESSFHITVSSHSKVRVRLGKFKREFFSFDYDSAQEWASAVYSFVAGLLDRDVTVETVLNKSRSPLAYKLYIDNKFDKPYYIQLCTPNFLSVRLNRRNAHREHYHVTQRKIPREANI